MEFNILFWLFTKHIIADYYMQYPWMYRHKGKYGHPGGLAHAGLHGIFTYIVLMTFVSPLLSLSLALLDSVLHYHIDYIKSKAWDKANTNPSEQLYWIIHGTDQFAHGLTYFLIVHLLAHGHV
tara:strand:+ start:258 stop:626 length:369 start_codon:yes stop_codon:yes gene_type:complete